MTIKKYVESPTLESVLYSNVFLLPPNYLIIYRFQLWDKKICEYNFTLKMMKSLSQDYLGTCKYVLKLKLLQGTDALTQSLIVISL